MKRKLNLLVILFLLFCSSFSHSERAIEVFEQKYSVQIGAFRQVSTELIDQLKQYGSIHTQAIGELTRVMVGQFSQKKDAALLLNELVSEGYTDAFITKLEK